MAQDESSKLCFVIAPIGDEGDEIRSRSDQVLTHLIKPAVGEFGYEAIRADQISEPGNITSQVIQHVIDDALLVADLTGRNPNVFYELAIRHAIRKPVIQIIQDGEIIPFDIAHERTIKINHHDLDSVAHAKEEMIKQIKAVEANPTEVDTPISAAMEIQLLKRSDNPLEKSNAEIISMLQEIRSIVEPPASTLAQQASWLNEIGTLSVRAAEESKEINALSQLLHEFGGEDPGDWIGQAMQHLSAISDSHEHLLLTIRRARLRSQT